MKLFLSVISAATGSASSLQITLDKQGATLGRREDNTLALPDAKRFISGRHAVISYQAPDYFITDTSANGLFINNSSTALGNGNSTKLNDGDLLHIGDYTIAVKLLEDEQQAAAGFHAGPLTDERFNFPDDPFADIAPDPIQRVIDKNELIPADWKDKAKTSPDPFDFPDLSSYNTKLVDEHSSKNESFEHVPAYKNAFEPFRKQTDSKPGDTASPPQKIPNDFFDEDWLLDAKSSKSSDIPDKKPLPTEDIALKSEPTELTAPISTPERPFKAPDVPKATPDLVANAKYQDVFLRNFLRGAELENSNCADAIDAESFYIIGKMLRASIQGAIEVLLGRAKIKNEMHLDVTVIKSRQNNPIKFSVSADEALAKLLARQEKGYMPPEEAIREAFDDIRAHQYAVIAGMQTALLAVLKRFDPKKLEQRLQEISPIGASIPLHRQAKLWGLFAHLYQDIEREAEDNFYHLFGQAFAETYELQMQKLKQTKQDVLFD